MARERTSPARTRIRDLIARLIGAREAGGRDPLGDAGEALAAAHLRRMGYRVLGRNLRVPMGEADILALAPDGETVVLAEVKSRRVAAPDAVSTPGSGFVAPPPEASITLHKQRKLGAILDHLARANGWRNRALRIDALAVEWPPEGEPVVRHHTGVATRGGRQGATARG